MHLTCASHIVILLPENSRLLTKELCVASVLLRGLFAQLGGALGIK